ncbi:hypothetical protein HNP84_008916 [Thermocatellispora tengchongensis]|uniref:Uncharacterized protein n=1 Tax=Thermocatellispora tengchongensis TaxID=1073253 RepID=A0A840PMC0_9ACTN|nr:hypothetical protein [Thermocatellispora tengchongensis]MBB5139153.1 hypothetical protein [Thermocatellispora tengchongensis]
MKPHAEVEEIWPGDGRVRVLGLVHGLDAEGGLESLGEWRAALVLREPAGPELDYPATVRGKRFELSVPIGDLIAPQAPDKGVWDLYLRAGDRRLRVGRRLDDIRDKASIMVFPAQLIPVDEGFVHVRPRYTVNENVSIDYWYGP